MTAGTRLQEERLHPEVDLALARKIVLDGLAGYAVRVFLFGSRDAAIQRFEYTFEATWNED